MFLLKPDCGLCQQPFTPITIVLWDCHNYGKKIFIILPSDCFKLANHFILNTNKMPFFRYLANAESQLALLKPKTLRVITVDQLNTLFAVHHQPTMDTFSTSHSSSCAICLDDFDTNNKIRQLPCGHIFHSCCIVPWLLTCNSTCPLCKHDYYEPVDSQILPTDLAAKSYSCQSLKPQSFDESGSVRQVQRSVSNVSSPCTIRSSHFHSSKQFWKFWKP